MEDLISRSKLIELIKSHTDRVFDEVTEKTICEMINEQPTAYDVEKVGKQLKKNFMKNFGENWIEVPYLIKTIEIVERGGIDDAERF